MRAKRYRDKDQLDWQDPDLETFVAEGIETQSHFAALKALGCHLGQGYFMCRPMAMADFFTKFIDDCQIA